MRVMAEKKGHFEKGRWLDDEEITEDAAPGQGTDEDNGNVEDFDEKVAELKSSISKNLTDLFGVGKALITTEKGREHLAKKVKKAEEKIDKTIEDIAEGFEKALKK